MGGPISIAIDGPVGSGKTAVGGVLAGRLGIRFLDTGLMYRAVTLAALARGLEPEEEDALSVLAADIGMEPVSEGQRLAVDGEDVTDRLRSAEVERRVSAVSAISGVREALVSRQRRLAANQDIVMAGRDIGTVVLPDADLKVYLDASIEVRARRRHRELASGADPLPLSEVTDDLARRDGMDSGRADSPLRAAPGAARVDTDSLDVGGVVERILAVMALQVSLGWKAPDGYTLPRL